MILETVNAQLPRYDRSVFQTVGDFVDDIKRISPTPLSIPVRSDENPASNGTYIKGFNSFYWKPDNETIYRVFQRRYHRVQEPRLGTPNSPWSISLLSSGGLNPIAQDLVCLNLSAQGICLGGVAGIPLRKFKLVQVKIEAPRRDLDRNQGALPGGEYVTFVLPAMVTVEKDPKDDWVHLSLELPDLDATQETRDRIRRWHAVTRGLFPNMPVPSSRVVQDAYDVLTTGMYKGFFERKSGQDLRWIRTRFMEMNNRLLNAPHLGHLSLCKGEDSSIFVSFLRSYKYAYFGHQIGTKYHQKKKDSPSSPSPGGLCRKTGAEKWRIYLHGFGTTQLAGNEQNRFCMGYLNVGTNWMTAAHDSFIFRCHDDGFPHAGEDDAFRADVVNVITPVMEQPLEPDVEQPALYDCRFISPKRSREPWAQELLDRCFNAWDDASDFYKPLYRSALDLVDRDDGQDKRDLDRYHLKELAQEFDDADLHRSRSTLTVTRNGELVMWGNLEQSSPCLNATGVFDCLKLFYPASLHDADPEDLWNDEPITVKEVLLDAHRLLLPLALQNLQMVPWTDLMGVAHNDRPRALNVLQDTIARVDRTGQTSWLTESLCSALELEVKTSAKSGILWIIRQSLVPDFLEHVAAATCPGKLL